MLKRPFSLLKFSNSAWCMLLLVFLLLAGLGIRLFDLTDLPNDFYMVRQYRALLIARGMYYAGLEDVESWRQAIAVEQWQQASLIEPPLLEMLAALTYRLTGENIWVGRAYSSLFWLAGGVALWLLGRSLSLRDGSVIALAYFLFLQFGVIASRTFMPDPLMVAMMAWALWALYRWEMRRTRGAAVLAGILLGLAVLVKSVAVFPLAGAALGLVLSRKSFRKIILDGQTWLVAGLTALPTLLYYIYGIFFEGSLGGQFSLRFFPVLLADPSFYVRWLFQTAGFGGFLPFLLALLGTFLFPARQFRWLWVGLGIGYVIYGVVFPYHLLTHDYYHLPIVLIIAIGLMPSAEAFLAWLWGLKSRWIRPAVTALLLLAVGMKMWDVRNILAATDYRHEVAYWQELGDVIGHDKAVFQLSGDYGYRLAYFGWVSGPQWLTVADWNMRLLAGQQQPDFGSTFAEQTAGMDLFVVTSLPELENQPELAQHLSAQFPLLSQGDGYLIYDLRP